MPLSLVLSDIPGVHHQKHLQRLANNVIELLRPPRLALDPRVVHIGWPHRGKEDERRSTAKPSGGAAAQQCTRRYLPKTRSKVIKPRGTRKLRRDDGFECLRLHKVQHAHSGKNRGKPIFLKIHAFHGTPPRSLACPSSRARALGSYPQSPRLGPQGSRRHGCAAQFFLP